MDLESINHSVFKLKFCLILATRNGNRILNDSIVNRLIDIFKRISIKYNIKLEDYLYDDNNIKFFFSSFPNINLSKFLNAYKSASSRLIKKDDLELHKKIEGGGFWDNSYCLLTLNSFDENIVKYYLENKIERK